MRKISYGEGVERVFPLYSPMIDSIKVVRRGKVRRAKLYYLRGLRGKAARITERQDQPHGDRRGRGGEVGRGDGRVSIVSSARCVPRGRRRIRIRDRRADAHRPRP